MADNVNVKNATAATVAVATDELSDSSQSPKVSVLDGTGSPAPISPATSGRQDTANTRLGAADETAPASDTASSGLNGRLQRIAQRLTSLIALIPASLGAKTSANSLAVVLASDQATVPIRIAGAEKATYIACGGSVTVAGSPTDIVVLHNPNGSGKVITIESFRVVCAQNAANPQAANFIKRSTLNTGGTATTPTPVPMDSSDAAAVGVVSIYTANPTTGTAVFTSILEVQVAALAGVGSTFSAATAGLVGGNQQSNGKRVVLRPDESFAFNCGGSVAAGFVVDSWDMVWTES